MKKFRRQLFVLCVLFISLTILPHVATAQPTVDPSDPDAPIDGGISLLVAAGIGYGVKKVKDNKKKKTADFYKN